MVKKILFLVPYPLTESPSQRFRFEQYFQLLEEKNFRIKVQSFLSYHNWQVFFRPGQPFGKMLTLMMGFSKRIDALFRAPFYDFIFIHREVAPLGPPVFEWILARLLRKKVIYDFDDAIWLTDRTEESSIMTFLKCRNKVRTICKWSYKISCGNEYLSNYARQFNMRVIHNPTTVDTIHSHNPGLFKYEGNKNQLVIGWTGSHSTLKYLQEIEGILKKIEIKFPFVQILTIADQKPSLQLKSLNHRAWNSRTEVKDLLEIDIGIMPLPNNEWSKGKCGFKALQYMSLNIPAIASAVGVITTIIEDGANGFLCNTPEDWESTLIMLIENPQLRNAIGKKGRKTVEGSYSVASNSSNFLSLFE